jgi:hypothetical protein
MLLILQIEYVTDAGEKVAKAIWTGPILGALTHSKLNLSMPPVSISPWDDALSMLRGELQIARMRIGQLGFLKASVGSRSTKPPGSDIGSISTGRFVSRS